MLRFLNILLGIFAICIAQNTSAANLKLQFVTAIWRHGDRAALKDLYPISEANWTFGGGGFGELTPIGMNQMVTLGGMLRKRYVDGMEFLNTRYAQREVHIRSTDVNRTILSAMSLVYGLFPAGAWNIQGVDYPTSANWQQGFTFVPIHVDGDEHCDVNQNCQKCPRMDELEKEMRKITEYQKASVKMLALNQQVAAYYNVTENIETFYWYPDTWKCQRNWFNDTLYKDLSWYNEDLYLESQETFAPLKRYQLGQFENDTKIDGIDIGLEMKILKVGPLINEIYMRAQEKLDCVKDLENCTSYSKDLKFYGYSSHDNIVYGLVVALGLQDMCKSIDGWPEYSSTIVFEFYSNPESLEQFFKILYRDNSNSELADVTEMVSVCNGAQFCEMQNLQNVADYYKPKPDFQTLCQTSLDQSKAGNSDLTNQIVLQILSISLLLSL